MRLPWAALPKDSGFGYPQSDFLFGICILRFTRLSYSGESQAKYCGYVIPQI
jgi:hypothetical protein